MFGRIATFNQGGAPVFKEVLGKFYKLSPLELLCVVI